MGSAVAPGWDLRIEFTTFSARPYPSGAPVWRAPKTWMSGHCNWVSAEAAIAPLASRVTANLESISKCERKIDCLRERCIPSNFVLREFGLVFNTGMLAFFYARSIGLGSTDVSWHWDNCWGYKHAALLQSNVIYRAGWCMQGPAQRCNAVNMLQLCLVCPCGIRTSKKYFRYLRDIHRSSFLVRVTCQNWRDNNTPRSMISTSPFEHLFTDFCIIVAISNPNTSLKFININLVFCLKWPQAFHMTKIIVVSLYTILWWFQLVIWSLRYYT